MVRLLRPFPFFRKVSNRMNHPPDSPLELDSIRPLVRYVDREQAVLDLHFTVKPDGRRETYPEVLIALRVTGSDGFEDEGTTRLTLAGNAGSVRFDLVHPDRWWPAGMGDQPLYRVEAQLLHGNHASEILAVTFGLTSVRRDELKPAVGAGAAGQR